MAEEEQFLETSGETAGDITLATGINWSALGKSMVGSAISVFIIATSTGIEMVTSAYGLLLGGLSGWVETAIETAVEAPLSLLAAARAESLASIDGVGALVAFPIGVGLVLGGLWIVAQGVEVLR